MHLKQRNLRRRGAERGGRWGCVKWKQDLLPDFSFYLHASPLRWLLPDRVSRHWHVGDAEELGKQRISHLMCENVMLWFGFMGLLCDRYYVWFIPRQNRDVHSRARLRPGPSSQFGVCSLSALILHNLPHFYWGCLASRRKSSLAWCYSIDICLFKLK